MECNTILRILVLGNSRYILQVKALDLFTTHKGEEDIKFVTNIALASRYLERIGDQSVNIGDRVLYFLTGDYSVFHDDFTDKS